MPENIRLGQFGEVLKEMISLFAKKNEDYGDAFADMGPVGVIVTINNKIRRLQNISRSGIILVEDETTRDTLIDLANYAVMAVMLLDEKDGNKLSDAKDDEIEDFLNDFLNEKE